MRKHLCAKVRGSCTVEIVLVPLPPGNGGGGGGIAAALMGPLFKFKFSRASLQHAEHGGGEEVGHGDGSSEVGPEVARDMRARARR